jgi:outer membrane protein OmpA-like peptidoglycan-associated protein
MGMWRAAALAATLAICIPAAHGQKDQAGCTADPVFSRFPNTPLSGCERSRFTKLELYRAKDPGKIDGEYEAFAKEGEFWGYYNYIGKDASGRLPSRLEVFRNFENALKQGGGEMLWADGDRKFYYRMQRPSGEFWGFVGCGGGNAQECNAIQHKTVRIAAMEQNVVISADQIGRSLADTGKVVFYGIYFDTDKAVLKAESEPTLKEMAKFLKANAAAKVFIVGHTDSQGALERNQKLSRERAAAVVKALAGSHGIAADRMTPEGVGPLAPVAANDAEAGRAKNRRVEMVLR